MSTANTATAFLPTPFLPRYPDPLPIVEPQAFPTAVATTPAALEFALLEAWLASSHTLQLPLHQIEAQQADQGPRGAALTASDSSPTPRRWRCGACAARSTSGRRGVIHPSPAPHPFLENNLRSGGDSPHGLLPQWRTQHLSTRSDPRAARPLLLLRTAAAFGQGGGAEPLPRIGRGYPRPHRRFPPQPR